MINFMKETPSKAISVLRGRKHRAKVDFLKGAYVLVYEDFPKDVRVYHERHMAPSLAFILSHYICHFLFGFSFPLIWVKNDKVCKEISEISHYFVKHPLFSNLVVKSKLYTQTLIFYLYIYILFLKTEIVSKDRTQIQK